MVNRSINSNASGNARQLFTIFVISAIAVALFLVILQEIGTPSAFLVYLSFAFLAFTYPIVAILSRTMNLYDFQTGGRRSVPRFVGMGIAAATISGGVFLGQSGELFTNGYQGVIGLAGIFLGLVFTTLFFSSPIGSAKRTTLSGFIAGKRISLLPRLTSVFCVVFVSFLLLVSQLSLARSVAQSFFEIPGDAILIVGLFVVVLCMVVGGMRGLTWIRAGLYVVIAASFILPIGWISIVESGVALPHLSYGFGALEVLGDMGLRLSVNGMTFQEGMQPDILAVPEHLTALSVPITTILVCTIAACIASMPHILQHFGTVKSASDARTSGVWAIGLAFVVLGVAPAYAAFMKSAIFNSVPGNQVGQIPELLPWILEYSSFEGKSLLSICGATTSVIEEIVAACGQGENYRLLHSDIFVSPDMITLGSAVITDLPPLYSILLGIGLLAAIFSTVDGLLLVIANNLAHDGLYKLLGSKPATGPRIFFTRFMIVIFAIAAGGLCLRLPMQPTQLAGVAIVISGATFFMPLLLRIYLPICTNFAVSLGMIAGLSVSTTHSVGSTLGFDFVLNNGDELTRYTDFFPAGYAVFSSALLGIVASAATIAFVSFSQRILAGSKPDPDGVPANN